ncbi:unnamed protein product, partial [Ectocarpus fasciculatus]
SPPPKLLVLSSIWPEPTSSAAGLRDYNLVRSFQSRGWAVHYAAESKLNEHSATLNRFGVQTTVRPANDSSFDRWVAEERPDVVIFDTFVTEERFGSRVAERVPWALRVLDTQDLHFLRCHRQRAVERLLVARAGGDPDDPVLALSSRPGRSSRSPEERYAAALTESLRGGSPVRPDEDPVIRELAAIYRSDLTLIISDHELSLLSTPPFSLPPALLHLSRFQYPPLQTAAAAPFQNREHFCMIGNFRHAPNMDAVRWMKEALWAPIRARLPRARLHVFGSYPPREAMALSAPEDGFIVKGPVKDHFKMLRKHRVNLAPLRFGAGIKGKISDGWWSGTPVVTTPVGAEGMHGGELFGGIVADSAEGLVDAAVRLYSDEEQWRTAHALGARLMDRLYSEQANSEALVERILRARRDIEANRRSNVVGSMLWYNLHRSTKYFSQWIEAKNASRGSK